MWNVRLRKCRLSCTANHLNTNIRNDILNSRLISPHRLRIGHGELIDHLIFRFVGVTGYIRFAINRDNFFTDWKVATLRRYFCWMKVAAIVFWCRNDLVKCVLADLWLHHKVNPTTRRNRQRRDINVRIWTTSIPINQRGRFARSCCGNCPSILTKCWQSLRIRFARGVLRDTHFDIREQLFQWFVVLQALTIVLNPQVVDDLLAVSRMVVCGLVCSKCCICIRFMRFRDTCWQHTHWLRW